jgi:hypothetical protein
LVEGSNSLELDANNDLVYTAPGTLKVNSADASGYIAEFNQTNTSNSGQILINSPTDGESRPVLIDMARAGNIQWSLGQGYLDTTDAFNISTTSLASGISGRKLSIAPNGNTTINGGTNTTLTVNSQSSSDNHSIAQFVGNTDGNQASLIVRYYSCGANDGRSGLYWQHENLGNMRMWVGDDLRLRMQGSNPASANTGNAFVQENLATTDNIKMGAGKGIDFSANGNAAGMSSEVLDDYEEGTWTPTIRVDGAGTAWDTITDQIGTYIKIGSMVHLQWQINYSGHPTNLGGTIGNYGFIAGLPFSNTNSGNIGSGIMMILQSGGSNIPYHPYLNLSQGNTMPVYGNQDSASPGPMRSSEWPNASCVVRGSFTYYII